MVDAIKKPRGALLVGSVPLKDVEQVFRTAAGTLGKHLKRIPDGETGTRAMWIVWQSDYIAEHPAFDIEKPLPGQYAPLPRYRLKDEAMADGLTFPKGIGYASVAKQSYASFRRLKGEGVISIDTRFQVSLPTPLAPITQFISRRDQARVEPAYQRQMLREVEDICHHIPHEDLAIQWDVALEMGMWEDLGGLFEAWFEPVKQGVVDRLVGLAERVPEDVELGFHLCYGDFGHEHFKDPEDTENLTELSNRLSQRISRPINWIHMPVPRDRSDDAFFAPLAELRLNPATELYLGLVHMSDGVEGAMSRIAAAQSVIDEFGVATECGFGRRPAETVQTLMALHAEVADPTM